MGRALIHCAADYGQCEVIELLLAKGANVNVTILLHHVEHYIEQYRAIYKVI